MIKLSPSQLSIFKQCPMLYYYQYIAGRTPIREDEKLSFGRLWDVVVGALWSKGKEAAINTLETHVTDVNLVDIIKVSALLRSYEPPPGFVHVDNQVRLEVDVISPKTGKKLRGVRMVCKLDGIMRNEETGITSVRETKITTKVIDGFGPFWQTIQIDSQSSAYWIASDADELIYDVVHKPGIKPSGVDAAAAVVASHGEVTKKQLTELKKQVTETQLMTAYRERVVADIEEDHNAYYQWRKIPRTPADTEVAMADLWQTSRMILNCRSCDTWPRYSHSCAGFYGTCQYIDVCSGRASLSDDAIFQDQPWKRKEKLPF